MSARAPITVLTPTIPGREVLLAECVASVTAQTVEVANHLICSQSCSENLPSPVHCARMQNALLPAVRTEWTMRLADDDLLLPHHVATLLPALEPGVDVVYSWDEASNRPRIDCTGWPQEKLIHELGKTSWIDGSAVAIRTDMLVGVGGWPHKAVGRPPFHGHFSGFPEAVTCEDHACFYRLACQGAKFVCIPQETWVYRAGAWGRISEEE